MTNVGIDATNLRGGGGRTHLIELLKAARPEVYNIKRIVVWGSQETLNLLEDRQWLVKRNSAALDAGMLRRSLWQIYRLSIEARAEECDVLFIPGGSYVGNFRPIVVMSQNMLPFDLVELKRYGCSLTALRLLFLRCVQTTSMRRADGLVFLTEYAKESVQRVAGKARGLVAVIPHGLNSRFSYPPRAQHDISSYKSDNPFRLLYVSIVDQYKHQWSVVEAVGRLRKSTGWPLVLDLVGPSYPPAFVRLIKSLRRWDPERRWVRYRGSVPYEKLHAIYRQADVGLFASSCENMPNILLEMMASGLPVACSDRGPMPEVLGNAGVFFDPLSPHSISHALEQLLASPELRAHLSRLSYQVAKTFTWDRCADSTLKFLAHVCDDVTPGC